MRGGLSCGRRYRKVERSPSSVCASISKSRIYLTELIDNAVRFELGRYKNSADYRRFRHQDRHVADSSFMLGMVASIADKLTTMKQERDIVINGTDQVGVAQALSQMQMNPTLRAMTCGAVLLIGRRPAVPDRRRLLVGGLRIR
jgi:uncharacterized protein (DUF849 family)